MHQTIPNLERTQNSISAPKESALTDHATHENHVIDWAKATVTDRVPLSHQGIKEAIHICKEGQQAMNRDEGSYQLSHAYDRFLDTTAVCRVKIWKN